MPEVIVGASSSPNKLWQYLETLKSFGEATASALKFIIPVATVLGAFLIWAFLHAVGAPMISTDVTSFIWLAVAFSALSVLLVVMFLFPTYGITVARQQIEAIFPPAKQWPVVGSPLVYVVFYAPFICLLAAFIPARAAGMHWLLISLPALIFLGSLIFKRYRGRAWQDVGRFAGSSFYASLLSGPWLTWVWILSATYIPKTNAAAETDAATIHLLLAILVVHFGLSLFNRFGTILVLGIGLLVVVFLSWPSFWGGVSLRALGLGGNVPVTLLIKAPDEGSDKTIARSIQGCLVLVSNNEVLIRPTTSEDKCSLKKLVSFPSGNPKTVEPYGCIDRYLRSDVIRFSRFSGKKTRDGIPISACE